MTFIKVEKEEIKMPINKDNIDVVLKYLDKEKELKSTCIENIVIRTSINDKPYYLSINKAPRSQELKSMYGDKIIGVIHISRDVKYYNDILTESFWDESPNPDQELKEAVSKTLDKFIADVDKWHKELKKTEKEKADEETCEKFLQLRKRWEFECVVVSDKKAYVEFKFPYTPFKQYLSIMRPNIYIDGCYSICLNMQQCVHVVEGNSKEIDKELLVSSINKRMMELEKQYIHSCA